MIVAFVHAKGNSTRVLNKNMQFVGDKPLFCHAIQNALKSKLVDKVVIDSDYEPILSIGKGYGATPLKRPSELANNFTTGDDLAYWQATNYPNAEIILQVVPTSPFIKSSSIDGAIKLLIDSKKDSAVGVHKEALYTWRNGMPEYYKDGKILNSFDMAPIMYETTGLYINRTEFVLSSKKRLNVSSVAFYELSKLESIDINTMDDLELAQIISRGLSNNELASAT